MTEHKGVYYNEKNPHAAQWLRNLIVAGLLAAGYVDETDIKDVRPSDLVGYTQHHFFAGIGVWPLALRNAGWPDDRPIWTGSCPCQPFSPAGEGLGFADERHLWPDWFHLVTQYNPKRIVGEQVARGGGLRWLELVQSDLESAGFAFAAVILSAAGFGAGHIRERSFFLADAERGGQPGPREPQKSVYPAPDPHREASRLVDALRGGALPFVRSGHDGDPKGVELLRAYGNAIDVATATAFIRATL